MVFLGMAIGFLSGFERVKVEKLKIEKTILKEQMETRTQSLELEKNRSQKLLATSPDWMFQINREFRIVDSNKTYPEFLKTFNGEWESEPFYNLFPPRIHPLILSNLQKALAGKSRFLEIPPHNRGGETTYLYLVLQPVENESQEVVGLSGIIRDVTERRRLELELQKTEKMSAIGTMAAGVAHELRNPLSVIRTALFNLDRHLTGQDEKTKRHISHINEKVRDANTIIDGLLNYARLGQPELKKTDIRQLLEWNLQQVVDQFPESRVKAGIRTEEIPRIRVDRVQISEVLQNIIKNAFEAMDGKGRITLKATYNDVEEKMEIKIADTGCGIPPKDLKKIGNLFFTGKAGGTGLGLALSYRIVEDIHRGSIEVKSEEGFGSVFTIKLPGNPSQGKTHG